MSLEDNFFDVNGRKNLLKGGRMAGRTYGREDVWQGGCMAGKTYGSLTKCTIIPVEENVFSKQIIRSTG